MKKAPTFVSENRIIPQQNTGLFFLADDCFKLQQRKPRNKPKNKKQIINHKQRIKEKRTLPKLDRRVSPMLVKKLLWNLAVTVAAAGISLLGPKAVAHPINSFPYSGFSGGMAPTAYCENKELTTPGESNSGYSKTNTRILNTVSAVSEAPISASLDAAADTKTTVSTKVENSEISQNKKNWFLVGVGPTIEVREAASISNLEEIRVSGLSLTEIRNLKEALSFLTNFEEEEVGRFNDNLRHAGEKIVFLLDEKNRVVDLKLTKDFDPSVPYTNSSSGISIQEGGVWLHLTRHQFQDRFFGDLLPAVRSIQSANYQKILDLIYTGHAINQNINPNGGFSELKQTAETLKNRLNQLENSSNPSQQAEKQPIVPRYEKKLEVKHGGFSVQGYTEKIPVAAGWNIQNKTLDVGLGKAGLFGSKSLGILVGVDAGLRWKYENNPFQNHRWDGFYAKIFVGPGIGI